MPVVFEKKDKVNKKAKQEVKQNIETALKKEKGGGVFSSFSFKPRKVNFETQEVKEKVILLLRRHWVTNLFWIFLAGLMMFVPFVLLGMGLAGLLTFIPGRFLFIGTLFWYLIIYSFILVQLINWYFNVYLVTDERVVDVDFYNLLYKQVSSTRIAKIQDVTYSVTGAVPALFNYGDVLIQTAGTEPNFEFSLVPRPAKVARVLGELMEAEEG